MTNPAEATALASLDAFGEPVTFNGNEVRGIPSTETVEVGFYEQALERRLTLAVMAKDVPRVEKGQRVVIRGRDYWVDQPVTGEEDPDVMVKVLLR